MAIAVGDHIELVAHQTMFSQQILNVFHYQVVSIETTITYEDIFDAFDNQWNISLAPLLSTALILDTLTARNLTNEIDIADHISNFAGDVSGESLPPFMSYGFRFNRLSGITRHGYKRFAGVSESVVLGIGHNPSFNSVITAMSEALAEGLVRTGTAADFEMLPVIIGRTKNENDTYELDLTRVNGVNGVAFAGISTQNTRKVGRGA